jgi:hypothetical protein
VIIRVNTGLVVAVLLALAVGIGVGYEYKSNADSVKPLAAEPPGQPSPLKKDSIKLDGKAFGKDVHLKDFVLSGMNEQGRTTRGIIKNTSSSTKNISSIEFVFMDSSGGVTGKETAMFLNPLNPGEQEEFEAGSVVDIPTSSSVLVTVTYY